MSLLDYAKKLRAGRGRPAPVYTREQEEVAVAYFNGSITLGQAAFVLGTTATGSGTSKLASIITQGVRTGTIKIELIEPVV